MPNIRSSEILVYRRYMMEISEFTAKSAMVVYLREDQTVWIVNPFSNPAEPDEETGGLISKNRH